MQIIYGILLISLLVLFIVLIKHLHIHASTDRASHKVAEFLEEHLELHNAKKTVDSNVSKPKAVKKKA